MNFKKIIAREFLLISISLILLLMFYGATYFYKNSKNKQLESEILSLTTQVNSLKAVVRQFEDSIMIERKRSIAFKEEFYNLYLEKYPNEKSHQIYRWDKWELWRDMTEIAESDELNKIWNGIGPLFKNILNESGIKTKTQFKEAWGTNPKYEVWENKIKFYNSSSAKKNTKIHELKTRYIEHENQIGWTLKFAIYIALVVFGLRYFFYAIKWSVKTIRE